MRAVVLLTLCILLVSGVAAIGVSPPKATIKFKPFGSGEFNAIVLNSQVFDIETSVQIYGPYAEYFTATNPDVPAKGSAVSTITYDFPEDITPGNHLHKIFFSEEYFDEVRGGLAARTSAGILVYVWKAYPGRYGELELRPRHVKEGEETEIQVFIYSKGTDPISGDLEVLILDVDDNLVDRIVRSDIMVDGDSEWSRYLLVSSAGFQPGKYKVLGEFDYGESVAHAESHLIIGTKSLLILSLTDEFYKDININRFEVELESLWNEPLENVYASMQLGGSTGITPTIILPSFNRKSLIGYWDTDAGLDEGVHNALVTAYFEEEEPIVENFEVYVYNQSPQPEVEKPKKVIYLGLTDILFILICIVIFIIIAHYAWVRRG